MRLHLCRVLSGRAVTLTFIAIALPIASDSQARRGEAEGQTRTALPDGKWLLVGGRFANGTFASHFVNDPATNRSTIISGEPRAYHSATVLPDGRVLIFGGIGADGRTIAAPELFTPEDMAFSAIPDSGGLAPRANHSATLLTNGTVLIAGGTFDDDSSRRASLASAVLWDPATQKVSSRNLRMLQPRSYPLARLQGDGSIQLTSLDEAQAEMFEPSLGVFMAAPEAPPSTAAEPARIVGWEPSDQTAVPIDARIGIRFSKPLRAPAETDLTLRLVSEGRPIPSRVVLAEQGMLAFLTPATTLMPSWRYSIELDGATDEAGNSLPFSTLPFTTKNGPSLTVAPALTDPATIKSIKLFVACLNAELGPKATTDIADSVTSCIPNACPVVVTMSTQSLQPACSLPIQGGGMAQFPRVILDCPGPAANKRFRPSYLLCPTSMGQGDPAPLLMNKVEIGEDNAPITFAIEREKGLGNMIMADIGVPPAAKLAAVEYGNVTSRGNGFDTSGTIGCESFCHKQPSPPQAAKGVLQYHPPLNPVSTDFRGVDLTPFVLYANIMGYPGLDKVPAKNKPPAASAPKNFKPVCDAISANKAKIVAANPGVTLATLNIADKLCTALLGKVQ